eukprot:scaffold433459_cov19-Prasinocladus_malaysianus.AAC.1
MHRAHLSTPYLNSNLRLNLRLHGIRDTKLSADQKDIEIKVSSATGFVLELRLRWLLFPDMIPFSHHLSVRHCLPGDCCGGRRAGHSPGRRLIGRRGDLGLRGPGAHRPGLAGPINMFHR